MPKQPVPAMAAVDSSSDDEAPEEISVSSSRLERVSQLKGIQEAEKRNKEEEKEKRRKRNELFRIQKEKKLKDLSKRKLPQDVLDAMSVKSAKRPTQEMKDNKPDEGGSEDDEDEGEPLADRLSDSGVEDDGDFIPVGNSRNLAVVTQEALARHKMSSLQTALNFKRDRLYGVPTIPRENAKQRRARAAKKKANGLS